MLRARGSFSAMVRDLSLMEAFERVADQDEWLEFCRLKPDGDPDVWIWVFSMRDDTAPQARRSRLSFATGTCGTSLQV
jgi:hypothetical protein